MLNDWDRMTARIDALLPDEHSEIIRELARQIDTTLGGFVRGQIMVCMALGVIYAVGLSVVGLQGGIFVGLLAGLVSFVPYVGAAGLDYFRLTGHGQPIWLFGTAFGGAYCSDIGCANPLRRDALSARLCLQRFGFG